MDIIPDKACPVQSLKTAWYSPYVAHVDILRLDILHPVISGNKWYKLKHNIAHALEYGYNSILTFGGAYSNHLVAAAAVAKAYNIKSIGIVRGLHAKANLTATLQACTGYGMELHFVSREDYDRKTETGWLEQLSLQYNAPFIVPEGGANEWGRAGAAEIAMQIPGHYTHICVSVGSGTTMAGLINALPADKIVYGYVPMKGGSYMYGEIVDVAGAATPINMQVFDDWHFGGFGKWNDELLGFMNGFHKEHEIPLDIIYTGKMMYGLREQIHGRFFPPDASILCIHTGGLQGNALVKEKLIFKT